ncbi:hypothetical protein BU15DRAFT_55196, partial [Melanogaster broomeanus]
CICCSSPVILTSRGLFSSSPMTPSIAIDFRVLELVKKLFVWMTPNTTVWCKTLESFFNLQGYKLQSKVYKKIGSNLSADSSIA